MNRDEKLTRVTGLPPAQKIINGCAVLAPSEPGGGTWIALNAAGIAFTLINWHFISAQVNGRTVSRGRVVNEVSSANTAEFASAALERLPLEQINPFRLIGFFPANHEIFEWRWDLQELVQQKHLWRIQQWISSGFDEPAAQRIRDQTFRQALKQKTAGRLDWLRRLHRSHLPQSGPFSTCMHRADAATVSYSELAVSPNQAAMRHHVGAPCDYNKHASAPCAGVTFFSAATLPIKSSSAGLAFRFSARSAGHCCADPCCRISCPA